MRLHFLTVLRKMLREIAPQIHVEYQLDHVFKEHHKL